MELALELSRQVSAELWADAGGGVAGTHAHQQARALAANLLDGAGIELDPRDAAIVAERAASAAVGAGPIDECLADPDVSEVMINGPHDVRVERNGKIETTPLRFRDADHLEQVAQRLMTRAGRRVDRSTPVCDGRLPDGSRLHVVLPPVAVDGPYVTVRRLRHRLHDFDELVAACGAGAATAQVLIDLVQQRANVLVCGGTGSGKTTWVATLLDLVPESERIVVIEDALELPLRHPHSIRLEARPASVAGAGEVTIRDLVKAALRMRPDRLVVGEVRSGEAFDLLQALHTGHRGCWSTLHANSPADALGRLATLAALAAPGVPEAVLKRQADASIDAIIQLERLPDGSRRINCVERLAANDG